jgi:hypothetical protein
MKKYLLLASVAALAFTSCSDQSIEFVGDEVAQKAREITFTSLAMPSTRAVNESATGTVLPDQPIWVSAYSTATTAAYFTDVEFDKNYAGGTASASDNIWGATGTAQYWPLSPTRLNFLGITGVASHSDIASFTHAGATITWNHQTTTAAYNDVMYGVGTGTVTQPSGNALVYSGTTVAMPFKHALAFVEFKVAVGNASYADAIRVNSIEVKNMVKKATFALSSSTTETDTSSQTSSGVWSKTADAGDVADVTVPGSDVYNSTAPTATLTRDGILLVPCKSGDGGFDSFTKFIIHFTMNNNAYTYEYTPATTKLEQGHKYTYNITLTLTEIRINATVEAGWDNTDTPINVPGV